MTEKKTASKVLKNVKVGYQPEAWEIGTPLMQRTTCPTCTHMHRPILAIKSGISLKPRCACCAADAARSIA
jgi:hypothetical protein